MLGNKPSRAAPGAPIGGDTSPAPYTPQNQYYVERTPSVEPGSGRSQSQAMSEVYEHQGLSSNAMQASVLSGKVTALQNENSKGRKELKEAMEKLSVTTARLNEQKVQNSSLMHKYSSTTEKLSAAEDSIKNAEEALGSERRAHQGTQEMLDLLRDQMREKEDEVVHLRSQVQTEKSRADRSVSEAQQQPAMTAATIRQVEARCQEQTSELMLEFERSLDRLLTAPSEDDTAIFVARSAVLSAATDLDTKLANTQNLLQSTIQVFNDFSKSMEDETSRMILSLMTENKELWSNLTKAQFELDKAQQDLQSKSRASDVTEKEYLQQQIQVLEQNIQAAHNTIEEQTKTQQRQEDAMRRLMDEHAIANQKIEQLQEELEACRLQLLEKEKEAKDAAFHGEQAVQQTKELQQTNEHQSQQIVSLTEQLRTLQATYGTELKSSVRNAQQERDDALEEANKLRSDLEDALAQKASIERELDTRAAYFNNYKVTQEENHAQYIRSLQDDIAHHKSLYERELEDMRKELQEKSDQVYDSLREAEAERTQRMEVAAALRAQEDDVTTLRHELTAAQEAMKRSEERANDLQTSLDQLRDSAAAANSKARELQSIEQRHKHVVDQMQATIDEERFRHNQQVQQLEASWKETENSRSLLQEEVHKLRQRGMDEAQLKAARDRFEKDKEQLMAENVRLHQEYQEVQQKNVNLEATISQLQARSSTALQFQDQVEDLQRRMAELPALRQQADECQREAHMAREEAEALRRERDDMSSKLEYFLEASKVAAHKDEQKDRLLREATSQMRRLHQQVEDAGAPVAHHSAPRTYQANTQPRGGGGGGGSHVQRLDLQTGGGDSPSTLHQIEKQPWR